MNNSIFKEKSPYNIDKILKKCRNYKTVSFDVFDTLIKRNVSDPSMIFWLLNKYAEKNGVEDFSTKRKYVENILRREKKHITINEIYDELLKYYKFEFVNKMKEKEISLEVSYCQQNVEIFNLYKKLRELNIKIIAISDMYLTTDIICDILNKSGYEIDEVYVSCDCKSNKVDGSLFKYVMDRNGLLKDDFIHIGDNFKADYLGALKKGVKSILIKKNTIYFNGKRIEKNMQNKFYFKTYDSILNNNLPSITNYYEKFGYSILGPLVLNYCYWLKKMVEERSIKKIYFFSRDGYVLKKAFDYLFPNLFDTRYIYLSRRAIRIPYAAVHSTYDEIMKFFPKTKMLTPAIYLENFGLVAKKYEALIKKYDLKLNDDISYKSLFSEERYRRIFDEIHNDIIDVANQELKVLKDYLLQEGFEGELAIVDIGWHNSMQYYLEDIQKEINMNYNLYGFYVGLQENGKPVKQSFGYIYDDDSKYAMSSLSFIGLIESVFLALEGSTKNYYRKGSEIVPNLLEYEYCEQDIELSGFKHIQIGIQNFIKKVHQLEDFDNFELSGHDSYLPFKVFGLNPYLKDIKYFEDFRYYSEEITYFCKTELPIYYLFNLKKLKVDLYKSRWKIAFMKKVLKIPLPYYKIYKFFSKI